MEQFPHRQPQTSHSKTIIKNQIRKKMKTKPITEFNPTALKQISDHLEFSNFESEPVIQQITFSSFIELSFAISSIFSAIEAIGFNGDKQDLGTCAGLAVIGRKLLPTYELEFLDSLLIKDDGNKLEFSKIKNP